MYEKPSRVVQEVPDSDLAARYGSLDEPGHCNLTYEWVFSGGSRASGLGEALASVSPSNRRLAFFLFSPLPGGQAAVGLISFRGWASGSQDGF